jgi:hypothetical protein
MAKPESLSPCCREPENQDRQHFLANHGLYCLVCGSRIWPNPKRSPVKRRNHDEP